MCNRKFLILFVFFVLTGNAAGQDVTHEAVVSPAGVVISEIDNQATMESVMYPIEYTLGLRGKTYASYNRLDTQNDKIGHIGHYQIVEAKTITHVCYATYDISSNSTITAKLESVDTTGLYNGIIQSGAEGNAALTSANSNSWIETELGTSYTVTTSRLIAATFTLSSATGNCCILKNFSRLGISSNVGSAWTTQEIDGGAQAVTAYCPNVALRCSDGTYIFPVDTTPGMIASYTYISTSTTPRYIGSKFIVGNKAILNGFYFSAIQVAYDIDVILTDASGNTLKADDGSTDMSYTILSTYHGDTSSIDNSFCTFPKPKTINIGVPYYLLISPRTTSSIYVYKYQHYSEVLKNTVYGIMDGWDLTYVSSPSTVSFTEDDTSVAAIRPVFSHIEFPRFTQTLR